MVGVSSSSSGVRICSIKRNVLMVSTRASCLLTRSISSPMSSCTSRARHSEAKLVNGTFRSWANWATVSWSIMTRQERNRRRSPMTTASEMYGENFSWFSISEGVTFLPPAVMMMSFMRSVIFTKPSASMLPTSPVCSQPSTMVSAVFSGLR